MIIEKIYFIENSNLLDKAIETLNTPIFCLGVAREFVEMDYSKIIIECLPSQLKDIEKILATCV